MFTKTILQMGSLQEFFFLVLLRTEFF